jgi:hypothetical protein
MRDPKGPVKSYKSPEEIAKKHKVSLDKIVQQVKIGTKVEGEHTTSKSGAKITALQHVEELPDYYSKLKKMEKMKEGNLHAWFSQSKSKSGKPGWVQSDGSPCANEPGETKTPKCFSSSKLASMSKGEIRSAVRRKREQDPGQQQKTGAAKPTYVSTDTPKKNKMKEEFMSEEDKKGKGSGKKDACYHKVKARFKVWPSAYASGALVKCRKAGAGNWGNKSESVEQQYKEDTKYCLLCKKNEKKEECAWGPSMWDKYTIAKIHPANESVDNSIEEGIGTTITKALGSPPPLSRRMQLKRALIAREISKTAEKNKKKTFSGKAKPPQNESFILEDHKEISSGKKKDDEGYMANIEFDQIERSINVLRKLVKSPKQQLPAWVQSKITRAADFIDTAAEYMSSDEEVNEGLDMKTFKANRKKAKASAARADAVKRGHVGKEWYNSGRRYSPDEARRGRANMDDEERRTRHRSAVDPDNEDDSSFSASKTKNPKKLRKQKAMGEACWTGYKQVGMKKKGKKMVPNCVPANEDTYKTFSEFMQIAEVAAWQKKAGKNPSGGLNEKGRKSYERENPGSDLKAPQPEGGPRKRSFCARMGGMPGPMKDEKGRPTRKALALRKWKC